MTTTRTVYRENVEIRDAVQIELPIRSRILHAAPCRLRANSYIDIWYETKSGDTETRMHTLYFEGTGHPLVPDALYAATVVCPNGLVWHIYLDASTTAVKS